MRYYHVYTKGLEDDVIFLDREDYVVGMNYVAIACFQCQVTILAFVLMSNHFHFVIYSSRSDAERFIRLYKQMISHYIRLKYGKAAFLQRVAASCDEVSPMDDGLKRCIAYVLDNPVKAGLFCVPQGYEWGSACCYFSGIRSVDQGTPVTGYSVRELKRILHSSVRLDGSFRISPAGYIDPRSYVDYTAVEQIFGRPKSFEFFLSTSASSRKAKRDVIMFSDDLVRFGGSHGRCEDHAYKGSSCMFQCPCKPDCKSGRMSGEICCPDLGNMISNNLKRSYPVKKITG